VFIALSKDEIWGVRKACAESISQIAKYVTSKVRSEQLVQIFEKFSEDVSRWVKIEAYKQLGPFIATFNEPKELSTDLIQVFTGMAFQQGQSDNEMVEYCAYNFPAVCLTVGKDRWNLLEKAYNALVKDVQWKVRRTLAYSLHEIAKIVGTQITEKTLIPAFELFLRDLDEVLYFFSCF
jgi:serine/threonine-protein phosphatase 4 regulatory subunit 1